VQVFTVDPFALHEEQEESEEVRKRVRRAIIKQQKRYESHLDLNRNAEIKNKHIKSNIINASNTARKAAEMIHEKYNLNMRSYVRLHAVARTIADLKNRNNILDEDIITAHQIMGRDTEIFKSSEAGIDIKQISSGDQVKVSRIQKAIKVLSNKVGDIMLTRKITYTQIARESDISISKLKSILEGKETTVTEAVKKLRKWQEKQSARYRG
jgi:hypothetical protein